ncbi:MAG: hypothetical protein K6F99_03500 [Lachnospiraceae bacterium]|nr:hypothetical protein [Lachnospiraceae bacterium]
MGKTMIKASREAIEDGMEFLGSELNSFNIPRRDKTMAMLAAEESMVKLIDHHDSSAPILILTYQKGASVFIKLATVGEEFDFYNSLSDEPDPESSYMSDYHGLEAVLRNVVLTASKKRIKYINKDHQNIITIVIKRSLLSAFL